MAMGATVLGQSKTFLSSYSSSSFEQLLCHHRPCHRQQQACSHLFSHLWRLPHVSASIRLSIITCKRSACCAQRKRNNGESDGEGEVGFDISILEAYTEKVPSEVLILHALVDGEDDEVLIYKGISSSLMRPTAADVSEPVLPASAIIKFIDRVQSPYNHVDSKYIQKNISWEDFQRLL
ncbi:hypothetical protein O6H91_13G058600 [Diphasiastrum complanatum]|uniref:Uncharacterized protein n=1 Tax=Diphasiastrum complanatum TaxID=34168 RepID=A0ACC2BV39_DIPCM|nr:hypothetical protein O6H91_13G058600 [Diphasiastrum complanatum]